MSQNLTRRRFISLASVVGSSAALAACAPAATPTAAPKPTEAPKPAATTAPPPTAAPAPTTAPAPTAVPKPTDAPKLALPFPVDDAARNPYKLGAAEVDGQFFAGGFGDDYIKYAAKLMEDVHGANGVKVKVTSLQKVQETLRPRFVGGNPPDVIDNSGAGQFPWADLVNEGQCLDLAELMNSPSLDTPGKLFKDTLFPGSQNGGVYDGKQMFVNIAYTVSGIWNSASAFEKAGIKYPKTWKEMLDLCETIKKEGKMAPWTYQGKYPYYIWGIVWNQLVSKAAGDNALKAIDNLEPNAWKNPDVLRATQDLYALWDKGYIMPGTAGLTHRESQAAFLQGKAAFLPCGTWLENEEKTVAPAGFDMVVNPIPGYTDGKGVQEALKADGGEGFFVPAKAKNPKHGMEYLRTILSRSSAKWFAENVNSLMPVANATEGAKISSGTKSAIAAVANSKGANVVFQAADWYSAINKGIEQRMGELMTGKIKPEGFLDEMQKVADKVAKDPEVKKFKR